MGRHPTRACHCGKDRADHQVLRPRRDQDSQDPGHSQHVRSSKIPPLPSYPPPPPPSPPPPIPHSCARFPLDVVHTLKRTRPRPRMHGRQSFTLSLLKRTSFVGWMHHTYIDPLPADLLSTRRTPPPPPQTQKHGGFGCASLLQAPPGERRVLTGALAGGKRGGGQAAADPVSRPWPACSCSRCRCGACAGCLDGRVDGLLLGCEDSLLSIDG